MSAPVPGCPGCEALQARVVALEAAVAELKALLNQNSRNSSQPPSADQPDERAQRPNPPPSGRQPGGQRGHKGTTRRLFPPEAVSEVQPCFPSQCAGCGTALDQEARPTDPEPRKHHVGDLPPTKLHIIEYLLHRRTCPCCGEHTWAELPSGVPQGNWGPGVQALTVALTGFFRLSRRRAALFLETLVGHAPCVATVIRFEAAAVAALQAAVDEARQEIAAAEVVNVDETGWRRRKERPTLWVAVTRRVAFFRIGRRNTETFRAILPPGITRIVGSDRYVVYEGVEITSRQLCWAHLKRAFQALAELPGSRARAVGNWALARLVDLFKLWHQFRQGLWSRAELLARVELVQGEFRALLQLGVGGCRRTRNLCTSLLERWEALWTFLVAADVEPTNNAAERALRGAVLWRKSSFGHKSDGGAAFVETMLTVCGSLTLQERGVMPFLEASLRAASRGEAPPKLIAEVN